MTAGIFGSTLLRMREGQGSHVSPNSPGITNHGNGLIPFVHNWWSYLLRISQGGFHMSSWAALKEGPLLPLFAEADQEGLSQLFKVPDTWQLGNNQLVERNRLQTQIVGPWAQCAFFPHCLCWRTWFPEKVKLAFCFLPGHPTNGYICIFLAALGKRNQINILPPHTTFCIWVPTVQKEASIQKSIRVH